MPSAPQREITDGLARTETARRVRRFYCLRDEIKRRLDGDPPFTDEEKQKLALMIWPGGAK
jgi:hypothetical protein